MYCYIHNSTQAGIVVQIAGKPSVKFDNLDEATQFAQTINTAYEQGLDDATKQIKAEMLLASKGLNKAIQRIQ